MRAERGRTSPRGTGAATGGGEPRRNPASVGKGPVELWTSPSAKHTGGGDIVMALTPAQKQRRSGNG